MRPILILPLLTLAAPASAAVVETRANGFTISHEGLVAAKPETVFDNFVHPERWWNPQHTWWGQSENLWLDLRVGGCWCETTADGLGEAQHMRVTYIEKNKSMRLAGLLGPLSLTAANGMMTATFKAEGEGTKLTLTYDVEGHFMMPAAQLAPLVDQVLAEQFTRLTALK